MCLVAVEKGRVLQNAFTCHHTINTSELHALLDVRKLGKAAIRDDWNVKSLFDFLNYVIVGGATEMLVVLFAPTVHSQQRCTCVLYGFGEFKSPLFARQAPYLASYRHFKLCMQLCHHRTYELLLIEYERAVISFSGDSLRAP